jgi:hypothetical protein
VFAPTLMKLAKAPMSQKLHKSDRRQAEASAARTRHEAARPVRRLQAERHAQVDAAKRAVSFCHPVIERAGRDHDMPALFAQPQPTS